MAAFSTPSFRVGRLLLKLDFLCVHVYRVVILFLVETENRGHAIVRVHPPMLQTTCPAGPIACRQTKIYFDNMST